MKLEMEKIIYQTKVLTLLNIILAIFLGLFLLVFGITLYTDLSVSIEDNYPSILFVLIVFSLCIKLSFKKFTLTENEFIVEHPPLAFILKAKRIPLYDIEKLIFKEAEGRGLPKIKIYRASSEWITSYSFNLDKDDIQRLIDMLRSKGIQVECGRYIWK